MIKYEPVPISQHDELLGIDFSERFATQMKSYYQPYLNNDRNVILAKEVWEYAVADSIDDGVWVGSGNNTIDVSTPKLDIDVKGISCLKMSSITTEASILQNNKEKSDNAMSLFKAGDFVQLKEMFLDPFVAKTEKNKNLHVLACVRDKELKQVWYCLLKVVPYNNPNLITEMKRGYGKRSIIVPFIDEEFGRTYLYISKRRLEIRLNMKTMQKYSVMSHSYDSIN
jgi:hypothetical protein